MGQRQPNDAPAPRPRSRLCALLLRWALLLSGGHNGGFLDSGAVYTGGLDAFFKKHLAGTDGDR